uniref:Putative secreted protein n=1 Tax=Anopheles darlingi TaxID=43151 RepID=A0A2M4D5J5_ANODA
MYCCFLLLIFIFILYPFLPQHLVGGMRGGLQRLCTASVFGLFLIHSSSIHSIARSNIFTHKIQIQQIISLFKV